MGELHLEVYIERMKREYDAEVEVGAPQVAYRETISQRAEFNYTHKNRLVVPVSLAVLRDTLSLARKKITNLLIKSLVVRFPVNLSPPVIKVSQRVWPKEPFVVLLLLVYDASSMTVRSMRWIHLMLLSSLQLLVLSRKVTQKPSPLLWSPS